MSRKRTKSGEPPPNQLADQLTSRSDRYCLTVEMALWVLVILVALVIRLARLDAAPLTPREAHEAMLAWRAAKGEGILQSGYSPLLLNVNVLLFTLFGASDSLARLWPALCGGVLALTPCLLRRYIGRWGGLAAGLYIALSPTYLFASRQLDGAVVAAMAWVAFLGGLARYFHTGRRLWMTLSAVSLALVMVSTSSAYGLLLTLGLAGLGLVWITPRMRMRWVWRQFNPHLKHTLAAFLCAGLMFSTGLGWNLAGLGAAGDLLPAWAARFGSATNAVVSPFTLLTFYELLAIFFGLGGLVWAVRCGHRFGILLGIWAGIGIPLLLLMPGRMELDILWVLLPLTMLAGLAVEQLVRSLRELGDWLSEGLHVPVVVLLWAHLYLVLARYALYGYQADLALAVLTIALQGLLAVIFALATRFDAALRAIGVGTGIVLLALTISTGWGLAHVRPSDSREPLVCEATAPEVHDLVQTLRHLSWRETGLPLALPVTLEAAPDSVLAWYLRNFTAVHRVDNLTTWEGAAEATGVLVTARSGLQDVESQHALVGGDGERVGQSFSFHRSWDMSKVACIWQWPPACHSFVGWWLLRSTPGPPAVTQQVTLWVPEERN